MNPSRLQFALFGNPVAHSLSPVMHRAAYDALGLHAEYSAYCVVDLEKALAGVRGMDIRGVSITLPFKESVLPFLDEVDRMALQIGSVNTVRNDNGRLSGFNTDVSGLMDDMGTVFPPAGRHAVVLGAGGAARSAVFGLLQAGASVTVVNRTCSHGEALARTMGCNFLPLSEIGHIEGDLLVNATPVGMWPETDASPVEESLLHRYTMVVDTIYNPLQTRLLDDARRAGCRTRNGVGMFVRQAAGQIRLWTGLEAPVDLMEKTVLERLSL